MICWKMIGLIIVKNICLNHTKVGYLESQNHMSDSKMILLFRKTQEIQGLRRIKINRNTEFISILHEKQIRND